MTTKYKHIKEKDRGTFKSIGGCWFYESWGGAGDYVLGKLIAGFYGRPGGGKA